MFKKVVISALSLTLVLSLGAFAFAASDKSELSASADSQDDIVFGESWTVDGQCSIVSSDGETIALPEFYDLFPEDWEIPSSDPVEISEEEMLAYKDLEAAPRAMKSDIIEARNSIISRQCWTVDGQCSLFSSDGETYALPEFYDLFPEDWDIPMVDELIDEDDVPARAASFYGPVTLRTPSNSVNTPPFYPFTATRNDVKAIAVRIPGEHYNLGFNNASGNSIGYAGNLPLGLGLKLENPTSGARYSVRASTNSTTGSSTMNVYE